MSLRLDSQVPPVRETDDSVEAVHSTPTGSLLSPVGVSIARHDSNRAAVLAARRAEAQARNFQRCVDAYRDHKKKGTNR